MNKWVDITRAANIWYPPSPSTRSAKAAHFIDYLSQGKRQTRLFPKIKDAFEEAEVLLYVAGRALTRACLLSGKGEGYVMLRPMGVPVAFCCYCCLFFGFQPFVACSAVCCLPQFSRLVCSFVNAIGNMKKSLFPWLNVINYLVLNVYFVDKNGFFALGHISWIEIMFLFS